MGLIKFSPQGWKKVADFLKKLTKKEINGLDMTTLLNSLVTGKIAIQTVAVNGRWCEVDSIDDLTLYERMLQKEKLWDHDWRF